MVIYPFILHLKMYTKYYILYSLQVKMNLRIFCFVFRIKRKRNLLFQRTMRSYELPDGMQERPVRVQVREDAHFPQRRYHGMHK